jgi:hypothetical protein
MSISDAPSFREKVLALYPKDRFYMEFLYEPMENKLSFSKSFTNPDLLDPYFDYNPEKKTG